MLTPWTGIVFLEGKVFFTYEAEKPLSDVVKRVHGYHNLFCVVFTLVIYIIITLYLLVQKIRYKTVGVASGERLIVVQAFIKFCGNFLVIFTMNFFGAYFQQSFWAMAAIPLFQIFNLLVMPLIVYVGFNRECTLKGMFKYGLQLSRLFTFGSKQIQYVASINVKSSRVKLTQIN
ncbi:hypothetical protein L596_026674 [Steinernema carpocapsae]|uniref:7TM GPCR serpentine receptor class x (Srx) domain-containing protein n=1 Tax=Steinernema carpocapsae TaxID=34508 RepID=A0A4U5M228_STECR|nr:hypothetical protein L596_026674 [Steinernema carpocapsae]